MLYTIAGSVVTTTTRTTLETEPVLCSDQCALWFEHECIRYYQHVASSRKSLGDAFNTCRWEIETSKRFPMTLLKKKSGSGDVIETETGYT